MKAKRAHEHTTMSYWCWQTTETTPTLLYQLSLQTNDCGPLPSSHYVQYTTIVTSHNTLLDLLDVRVHRQFKHSPCHRQWGPAWTGQWPVGWHQHGHTELHSGSWSFQHCQSCGAATPFWGPDRWWCWHGHPLQHSAGHLIHPRKRNELQVNTWLVQEWRCACTLYVWVTVSDPTCATSSYHNAICVCAHLFVYYRHQPLLHELSEKHVMTATGTNVPATLFKESALRLQWLQHAEWGVPETTAFGVQRVWLCWSWSTVNRK